MSLPCDLCPRMGRCESPGADCHCNRFGGWPCRVPVGPCGGHCGQQRTHCPLVSRGRGKTPAVSSPSRGPEWPGPRVLADRASGARRRLWPLVRTPLIVMGTVACQCETLASLILCPRSSSEHREGPAPGVPQLGPVVGVCSRPAVSTCPRPRACGRGCAPCGCRGSNAWSVPCGHPPPPRDGRQAQAAAEGGLALVGPSCRAAAAAKEMFTECPGSRPVVSPPALTS